MMTMMETIKKLNIRRSNFGCCQANSVSIASFTVNRTEKQKAEIHNQKSQSGMSLIAVMAVMTLFAISLLAIAPTVQQGVQREKELESIRRGEEVAEAVRQYIVYYQGKLPDSMDDLLEGLPQGTKKRQILRPSAAIDPLSEDGKWRLIEPNTQAFIKFAKRVQNYNNGLLPSNPAPSPFLDRYAAVLVNSVDTKNEEDLTEESEEEIEIKTDKAPFIGVASQSRSKSIIAYYGIENHSKWIFTPMFRGAGASNVILPKTIDNRSNPTNTR
jgi:type II secretory pathway pseudopilin PulG